MRQRLVGTMKAGEDDTHISSYSHEWANSTALLAKGLSSIDIHAVRCPWVLAHERCRKELFRITQ